MPVMQKVVVALLMGLSSMAVTAATLYISDELTVPLRRGPSNSHKIINAALPSGTALEVLGEDKDAGFTQVRTPNGVEGWVPTQYLTNEPAARDRLAAATKRAQTLEAELKNVRENYQDTRSARADAENRSSTLDKQTKQLQTELAEIRRVSATSIAHFEENKQLKTQNQELQSQVMQLTQSVRQLERNLYLRFFLGGGALVLIGLAVGAWIKARPKRSTWA
jgi:SH3 domain protein